MTEHVVFVAGATGYTGQNVVEQLCKQGVRTIAHVRPDSSRLDHWKQHFEVQGATVDASPWHLEAMTQALQKHAPTHVFCLIGTTRARKSQVDDKDAETYEAVDYGLTSLLIKACVAAGGPRFVYLSSLGVSESTPSSYLQARYKAETELKASGLEYVIARPSFISGDDRDESRPAERVGAVVADGFLSVAGALGMKTLSQRYQSLTGSELAQGLITHAFQSEPQMEVDTVALRP